MDLTDLAMEAVNALLMRVPVTVTHPAGWERPENWPLPIEKAPLADDGTRTQPYRPLALLEFIELSLRKEEA